MASVNERILDAEVGHQIDLQRYSNGVVARLVALLNRVDSDLFAQLMAALERLPAESFTVERLEQFLSSVRQLNFAAYQQIERELTTTLREFAEHESGYQLELFRATIPPQVIAQVPVNAVNVQQVYSAALSRPFQGRLLREWSQSMESTRMVRIRDAVRMGYVENQTTAQIVQRIRGTRSKGYADGLVEMDRRSVESVVRTAIAHTAAVTRQEFIEENLDLVKAVEWCSTLDSRTSPICQLRDGLQYTADTHKPIGHKVAWLGGPGMAHWGCRSTSVPVLRSWKELGIPLDDMDPGTRASMSGQVPADMKYADWLKKQSATIQDDVLGPTRAKEFRAGKPLGAFFNEKGRLLTLDGLKQRDARRREAVAA